MARRRAKVNPHHHHHHHHPPSTPRWLKQPRRRSTANSKHDNAKSVSQGMLSQKVVDRTRQRTGTVCLRRLVTRCAGSWLQRIRDPVAADVLFPSARHHKLASAGAHQRMDGSSPNGTILGARDVGKGRAGLQCRGLGLLLLDAWRLRTKPSALRETELPKRDVLCVCNLPRSHTSADATTYCVWRQEFRVAPLKTLQIFPSPAVHGLRLDRRTRSLYSPAVGPSTLPSTKQANDMLSLFEKNKTFKPRKKIEPTHPRYELHKLANEILKATLGAGAHCSVR